MKIKIISLVLLINGIVLMAPCLADPFDEKDQATADANATNAAAEAMRINAQANSKAADAAKLAAEANGKMADSIKNLSNEISFQNKMDRLETEVDRLRGTNTDSWKLHCAQMRADMAERQKEVQGDQEKARDYYKKWREHNEELRSKAEQAAADSRKN